jgi:quinoprotein glucose dehydrogenase
LGGNMANELVLDVLDAAAKSSYEPLAAKAQEYEQGRALDDRFAVYREVLYGGDPEKGRKLYEERLDLACARCHRLGDLGGDVGPNLAGIGLRLSKEKLLQSILYPNDEISPGFESVSVELREGGFYAGIVKDENDSELVLSSLEDGDMTFAKADISSRSVGLSAMPEQLINMLTKQDLRDLIEFLSELK